ncbi:MAG: hypothetical protein KKB31_01540 [Nanoarchaeota archaeon]|nr:hypothetical protein [Nanoarchaeota archaeon]
MEMNVLKLEKEEAEVEFSELTMAELLRTYLNKDSGVTFVAWKRMHPTEKPILKVKTKGKTAKKALGDAVALVEKDLDKVLESFKKLK